MIFVKAVTMDYVHKQVTKHLNAVLIYEQFEKPSGQCKTQAYASKNMDVTVRNNPVLEFLYRF